MLGAPALLRGGGRARSRACGLGAPGPRAPPRGARRPATSSAIRALGAVAVGAQLAGLGHPVAVLLRAARRLGLDDRAGVGAAAAVLFAVNVTAVLPATPSNLGVFQAACVVVLHKGYGVSVEDALGYGIILQAVEIATAFVMGAPALLSEGVSWQDVRLRAMHAAPVELSRCPPVPAAAGHEPRPPAALGSRPASAALGAVRCAAAGQRSGLERTRTSWMSTSAGIASGAESPRSLFTLPRFLATTPWRLAEARRPWRASTRTYSERIEGQERRLALAAAHGRGTVGAVASFPF